MSTRKKVIYEKRFWMVLIFSKPFGCKFGILCEQVIEELLPLKIRGPWGKPKFDTLGQGGDCMTMTDLDIMVKFKQEPHKKEEVLAGKYKKIHYLIVNLDK